MAAVRRRRSAVGVTLTLTALACADGGTNPSPCNAPTVVSTHVAPSASNVLSAFATARVQNADSVIVRYGVRPAIDSATPGVRVSGDSVVGPIFGLRASTTYLAHAVAFNGCGATVGDAVSFDTGTLPGDLPTYSASGSSPSPGYVVIAAGTYGIVIDNTGRVVWYHRFPAGPGLNFQAQPNGRFVARPPTVAGQEGVWIELGADGATTRTFGCTRGLQPRMHDVFVERDGSYWMMCDEVRTVDLSRQGASSQASVLGTAIQHRAATGALLWEWSPFDHLEVDLDVLDPSDKAGPAINWTHGNALDLDNAGSLFVSFRNLSEIVRIELASGKVVGHLGGAMNTFRVLDGDTPPFARQHGLRVNGDTITLLDNLGNVGGSRAERYVMSDVGRAARLVSALRSPAGIVAPLGGTTQSLAGGRTLVSYGSGSGVEEYDSAGNVVWRLTGNPGYIFRAQRIRSLYTPGIGDSR